VGAGSRIVGVDGPALVVTEVVISCIARKP